MKIFLPKLYVNCIYDIDFKKLKEKNIEGIIFDIDNTLVPYDVKYCDEKLIEYFNSLKNMGFKICLVSNNNKERVTCFNENLNFDIFYNSLKPLSINIKKAMQKMNTTPATTVLIGDQVFTDILGGNLLKLETILVNAISEKEQWVSKIKRRLEKTVLKNLK